MSELAHSNFRHAVEMFVKYARVKRSLFQRKAWVPKRVFDALVAAFPAANNTEKRLLGDLVEKLIASAILWPASQSGRHPGFLISHKYLFQLEAALRRDGLDWRVGFYTTGSVPGADDWGID